MMLKVECDVSGIKKLCGAMRCDAISVESPGQKNFARKKIFCKMFGYIDLTRLRTRKPG
jgi:hypothetical protein